MWFWFNHRGDDMRKEVETLQDWLEERAEEFRDTIFSAAEGMEAYHLRKKREEDWLEDWVDVDF